MKNIFLKNFLLIQTMKKENRLFYHEKLMEGASILMAIALFTILGPKLAGNITARETKGSFLNMKSNMLKYKFFSFLSKSMIKSMIALKIIFIQEVITY